MLRVFPVLDLVIATTTMIKMGRTRVLMMMIMGMMMIMVMMIMVMCNGNR